MNLFSVYIQIISISHRSFIRKRRSLEELIIWAFNFVNEDQVQNIDEQIESHEEIF